MSAASMSRPEVFDASIEKIETGDGFVVAHGWLITDGAAADLRVMIGAGDGEFTIRDYTVRPDIEVQGASAYGFCIDFPFAGDIHLKSEFIISSGDTEFTFHARQAVVAKFVPVAAFDPSTVDYVAGWVYDPSPWYNERAATPSVRVGEQTIAVDVSKRRSDLPFTSAKAGKTFGFQLLPTSYQAELARLSAAGGGPVRWTLSVGAADIAELILDLPSSRTTASQDFAPPPQVSPAPSQAFPVPLQTLIASPGDIARQEERSTIDLPVVDGGYIDYWSYSPQLNGCILGGWAMTEALEPTGTCQVQAIFGGEKEVCQASYVTYSRADVVGYGVGFFMYLPVTRIGSRLSGLEVPNPIATFRLWMSSEVTELDEATVLRYAQDGALAATSAGKDAFLELIKLHAFDGTDSLSGLGPAVQIGIDEIIYAPESGVVLIGWMLDANSLVEEVKVRTSGHATSLKQRWITSERPDIRQSFGTEFGLTHSRWGFTAYAPMPIEKHTVCYLEVQLHDGRVGYRSLPSPTRSGIAAINRILHGIVLTPDTILQVCKDVISEPVRGINRARMKDQAEFQEARVGTCPASPRASIIVPLYGRLDFLTYQMALVSRDEHAQDEFIYVLDQPERKDELFDLARITYIKTGIPFRIIVPSQNLGFAGASNLGLKVALGEHICFLNSDVFPKSQDWMTQLIQVLDDNPEVGVTSALMLFEDGTIQHAGMDFERIQQFGNMHFPFHPDKGRRPGNRSGTQIVPAVTGACMVMSRKLADEIGGFDEDYVIGDFEDADLCMKVTTRGLQCIVVSDVVLYHLERQSQEAAAVRSRTNLTLLNAWTFAERWDPRLLKQSTERQVLTIA